MIISDPSRFKAATTNIPEQKVIQSQHEFDRAKEANCSNLISNQIRLY